MLPFGSPRGGQGISLTGRRVCNQLILPGDAAFRRSSCAIMVQSRSRLVHAYSLFPHDISLSVNDFLTLAGWHCICRKGARPAPTGVAQAKDSMSLADDSVYFHPD